MMQTLVRLKDWRSRFEVAIDEIKAKPFEWYVHDCGPGLAGRLVQALTGVDLATDIIANPYHDEESAATIVRAAGFETLGALVASLLPEIHPSQAQIGDIAAIAHDGPVGHALGVVNGERIFVLRPQGLGTVSLLHATMAFRVG
ncbi:hypothetical protein IEI95_014900 [Agrobacterium vitis]|uniref:DUF6950 domain-containing protein n=2 Tax=Agrobacterium vitis TaxID=373 RepID=A0AAE2RBY5_AGRVI|nr:hypothetical protein [Agrobacterium vitis]